MVISRGAGNRGGRGRGGSSRGRGSGRGDGARGSARGGRGGRGTSSFSSRGGSGRGTSRGGSRGRGDGSPRGRGRMDPKKSIAEKSKQNFKRDQKAGGSKPADESGKQRKIREPQSARTKDIDLHAAKKIAHDFSRDINAIKEKLQGFNFGALDDAFQFVPPTYVQQHLPVDVAKFRTYFSRFNKGSRNDVVAFVKWFEWASYELAKTITGQSRTATSSTGSKHQTEKHPAQEDVDEGDGDDGEPKETAGEDREDRRKKSSSRANLAVIAKEREHMRALLQMCLRHNSTKRKEGQHALVNRLQSHLSEQSSSKSFEALRENSHHSVAYAVSRLVVGMVTENFANVALNCHALHLVLSQCSLHPRVLLTLLGEELSLDARMKAHEVRLHRDGPTSTNEDDDVDPDDINDPTKGERNQRIAAAIFTMAAVLSVGKDAPSFSVTDLHTMVRYLSFAYIEHKGLRVLSGNLILQILRRQPAAAVQSLLSDEATWKWLHCAFFRFPKMEYYRPEGIQLMVFFMEQASKPASLTPAELEVAQRDPLEPSVLEQIANALFRREQVTAYHPMVHPVWYDLLRMIKHRCAQGESLKQHISSFVHNIIAPYRRGAADSPRKALFLKLVDSVGQLALSHEDAEDRMEVVRIATKTVGFGKTKVAKATPMDELRKYPVDEIGAKVKSLIHQLRALRDSEPASSSSRAWAIKELSSCLSVPYRDGTPAPYVNDAVSALLELGFFPSKRSTDEVNMNRAVYLFAETFSFTYSKPGGLCRPRCDVSPNAIISAYLTAEEAKKTRFTTAVDHAKFRKARNRIVEAFDDAKRSVLFYDARDMHILLTLLFLMLSVDDYSHEAAQTIASSVVPDLVKFYKNGTLETLDVLYDVMMALVLRPTAPLHIMPLMTAIRRIATGYLYKFSRFIQNKVSLDFVLAPLVEGYNTNEREAARNRGEDDGEEEKEEDPSASSVSSDSASDDDEEGEEAEDEENEEEEDEEALDGAEDDDDDEEVSETSTVADEEDEDDEKLVDDEAEEGEIEESEEEGDDEESDDSSEDDASSMSSSASASQDDDDASENSDGFVEEEKPTQQYLNSLQHLAGGIDLGFAYPTDTENKAKNDVVRAINIATRVGLGMRSPLVVHVFQVLLAVMRSEVKNNDSLIFDAAKSNVEMLLMSRQRYFGKFLPAEELMQLLGDIQTYCRKLARYVVPRERAGTRHAVLIRKRLNQLKMIALSVFHYTCFLAYKNHGDETTRVTYSEFYSSIFYDRGWEAKAALRQLKRDLYHYRHAFAWALLPAAVAKFDTLKHVEGAQRIHAFRGACTLIEASIPRISGLPADLKQSASKYIRTFIESLPLKDLFQMKQTELYTLFHTIKFALQYNSKIQLDTEYISGLVDEVTEDDNLQVTKATIRVIASIERILDKTPKILATKAPVPVQVLYKQFETSKWRKEKSEFYRKAKIVRKKTAEALLAHRNQDPTDEERAKKRRRREELKHVDRDERETLRAMKNRNLTKEEKDARRKRMQVAKQDRIAKNKERKQKLHEKRKASFERWRREKLSTAEEP